MRIVGAGVGAALLLSGCNPFQFKACRDEMGSTQKALIEMDDQKLDEVQASLSAVERSLKECDSVAGEDDLAKLRDAETKLRTQIEGLRARQLPKERPKISEQELAVLAKKGDSSCPRGQTYLHPQNQQEVRCTGPQLIEMSWAQAHESFVERRGFSEIEKGSTLRFELGAEVVEFEFAGAQSKRPASCVTVVGQPGIAWQELVARATGVQPRRMKLGQAIPASRGPVPLIVEGDDSQFVVKLGKCAPTPGQKAYVEPEK